MLSMNSRFVLESETIVSQKNKVDSATLSMYHWLYLHRRDMECRMIIFIDYVVHDF
jgi:hypothetical protein